MQMLEPELRAASRHRSENMSGYDDLARGTCRVKPSRPDHILLPAETLHVPGDQHLRARHRCHGDGLPAPQGTVHWALKIP